MVDILADMHFLSNGSKGVFPAKAIRASGLRGRAGLLVREPHALQTQRFALTALRALRPGALQGAAAAAHHAIEARERWAWKRETGWGDGGIDRLGAVGPSVNGENVHSLDGGKDGWMNGERGPFHGSRCRSMKESNAMPKMC